VRAVRLAGAGRLEPVELPDPVPGEGEVVVRVAATGICGSDLSCFKTGVFAGTVLGHELGGVVEEVGPGAPGWEPGDRVAVDPKIPCGSCTDCLTGAAYRCVESLTLGIGGASRDGGFAELVRAPAARLHRLPDGVATENACLAEPLSVAIHGLERAWHQAGESALVIGLGPIGLLAVAALRARGAGSITGVDPVGVRRDLAQGLGAERVAASVSEVTDNVPLVVECSGRPEMLQEATNRTDAGGRVALLGVTIAQATVMPLVWVTREVSVVGSISSSDDDFAEALRLLAREPAIAGIITRRVALDEVPGAFEELIARPADGKVAVDPAR
jgi:L-idonate 5-dehydrogenase